MKNIKDLFENTDGHTEVDDAIGAVYHGISSAVLAIQKIVDSDTMEDANVSELFRIKKQLNVLADDFENVVNK